MKKVHYAIGAARRARLACPWETTLLNLTRCGQLDPRES